MYHKQTHHVSREEKEIKLYLGMIHKAVLAGIVRERRKLAFSYLVFCMVRKVRYQSFGFIRLISLFLKPKIAIKIH